MGNRYCSIVDLQRVEAEGWEKVLELGKVESGMRVRVLKSMKKRSPELDQERVLES